MKNNLESNLKDVARITVDDMIAQCRWSPAEYTFDFKIIQNAQKPPTNFDDDEDMISDQGFEVGELGTSIDSNAWEHAVDGNYEDALSLFRIAADIKRSALSNKDVGLAMTINSAGNAHFQRGNVPKAAELYEEAYHIVMKANSGGKDTRETIAERKSQHRWSVLSLSDVEISSLSLLPCSDLFQKDTLIFIYKIYYSFSFYTIKINL